MIRLTALNDDSSKSSEEDDVYPKEPPQEVQEENALKLYNEALQEQKIGNADKAETIYRQLLSSNFLMKMKSDEENIKLKKSESVLSLYSKPGLMLKYSCLKNLAVLSQKKNCLVEALDFYTQALKIEASDVSIWFQSGCLAMKLFSIRTALEAFLKGLEFSPKHWPSLDKLIICLFMLNDYVNCLHFISRAFEIDVNYTRGQVLRDYIISEQPSLQFDIKYFFPKINLHLDIRNEVSEEINNRLLNEVLNLCNEYTSICKEQVTVKKKIETFTPTRKIDSATWVNLGEIILQIQEEITNEADTSLITPINLKQALLESKLFHEGSDEVLCTTKMHSEDLEAVKPSDEEIDKKHADNNCDKKSKKNKGSALMEELLWSGKRRSARVRSSLRGNPEPMDVAEALRRILPRKLLHKTKHLKVENLSKPPLALEEDSMDTMDLYRLFERQESAEEKRQKEEQERSEVEQDIDMIVDKEGYFGKKNEEDDVKSFIYKENEKNITEIVKSYVMSLKTHWKKTWPNSLPAIYIKCFQLMRKYHPMDFKMCTNEFNFKDLVEESGCILLFGELCLEYATTARSKHSANESKTNSPLQIIFLQNIMELMDRREVFETEEAYFEFLLRLYWLRCRIFLEKGQTNLAIVALNDVLACYELFPQYQSTVIHLKNCRKHSAISKTFIEEFLAYQSRKRSLAEVVRLYEDESYKELTDILKDTFPSTPDTLSKYFKEQESDLVDRQTQLSMLINGLYHLNEFKECIYWLETCCYEILQKAPIQFFSNEEEGESWMITFDRFLLAIEDCLKFGNLTISEALPPNRLSRFVQTLCHAICKELEDSDRPPCPARPWIMLNTILIGLEKHKKNEVSPEKEEEEEEEEEDENDIPSSILILFTAHEYLGRREWCNCNESVLLFLIMDQVIPHIRHPDWSSFRETIHQHLEQVIYCLYLHPNKKSKARYLTDHNVNSIPLTWQRGIQLFELFRPDEIPSYDSLRINLISSETEVLFRRIAALIPDEKDPVQVSDKMTEFIVGKRNDVPNTCVELPENVQDLFYILGDYYFKTHEFAKAINYLLMDLCANPNRVDSWASMALSRASLLEQQLNSCDPLKDEVFLQNALSALRCYEHCLQLDNKQCALWIEYGSFVYTIHSFCSQRMKLESFNLSLEQFEELESTKNKMLETAKQAFVNANLIWHENKEENERQDERWLHHYMLGKICEKNDDLNYFDHYEKAADLLYENEAEFPSKVGYTTPQTLAIEALEVYYRVHVCIIKTLELNEGKPLDPKTRQLFNKYLNVCSKGPFARQISKGDLAKIKAKELEAVQQEKQLKIIKSVLNDLISKIESEIEFAEKECDSTAVKDESDEVIIIESSNEEETIGVKPAERKPREKEDSEGEKEGSVSESEKFYGDYGDEMKILKLEEKKNSFEDATKNLSKESGKIAIRLEQETAVTPLPVDHGECNENPPNNYFDTLEDLKNVQQPLKIKKKRRASQASLSSSSCEEEEVRYDDDSDSSSSSESSASSQTSSSSSDESFPSRSDETNKGISKVTDEDDDDEDDEDEDGEKQSEMEKNQKKTEKNSNLDLAGKGSEEAEIDSSQSEKNMLTRCLNAFETCAIRFPQHYKSVYRLAHFYFRSKEYRDIGKCRDLLLGRYETVNGTIPGLFAERKNTNFFNGIWRIPAGDVDRPGSFASHMSRSVLLLMEVLRDLKDHKMLLEICLQLRKTPEPDKKYLREDERNQLSKQACDLAIQTLRKNVKDSPVMTLPLVLDCYRCYQKVQKHYTHKETVYGDILLDAFKRLGKGDKCSLEQAIRFCQSEVSTVKTKFPKSLNVGPIASPKVMKPKKQEKRKSTPKPQITAKVVQKTSKLKKCGENKKSNSVSVLRPNPLMDPSFWSSVVKVSSTETKPQQDQSNSSVTGAQIYAEMLRTAALSIKHREQTEKKLGDHIQHQHHHQMMNVKNAIEQLKAADPNQKSPMVSPRYYQYPNYPGDLNASEKYKQLVSNYWNGPSFSGNLYGQFLNSKGTKSKVVRQQSVLKPNLQKSDPPNWEESKKNQINIEDILGKSSLTVTKSQPNSNSSSLIKSIEEKIKSISKEVNVTKCSSSQVINLSTGRKYSGAETGKRNHPDSHAGESGGGGGGSASKKICRGSDQSAKKDEIEVVIIDD